MINRVKSEEKPADNKLVQHEELEGFLSSTEDYVPPKALEQQKELDVVMAAIVAVRVFDEMGRKTEDALDDEITSLRQAIEDFGNEKAQWYDVAKISLSILYMLSKTSKKLIPINLRAINCILMSLLDVGMLKPPAGFDAEDYIRNTRIILVNMAGVMAKRVVEGSQEKAENN